MTFTFGNYEIDADIKKTAELYESAPFITEGCSCGGCCNFEKAVTLFPQEVKAFFCALGIDMRKAAEVYLLDGGEKNTFAQYGGFCHMYGTILRAPSDPGQWYTVADGYHVMFTDDIALPEEGLEMPAIQMEIDFSRVPWVL